MKEQGTVVKWEDARGFGFIRCADTGGIGGDIFFHVRDFRAAGGVAPRIGLAVTFERIHVGGKGPRGMAVHPAKEAVAPAWAARARIPSPSHAQAPRVGGASSSGALFILPLMATYAAALLWAVWTGRLPLWTVPVLFCLNALTFFAYWQDKWAAGIGQWRISESTLHVWGLVGGWPGAWFAQQALRHKSRKQSFRRTYWMTVILHCGGLGGWLAGVI